MIKIKNLTKLYANGNVSSIGLRDINLELDKGEIVCISGESGSGKSTLLNVITGLDSYDEGEILFNGEETSYFDDADREAFRRKNVAFIYQKSNIVDSYTALENVMLPLISKGSTIKEAKKRAKELLENVGLKGKERERSIKLSGGEKQRCAIARALAMDFSILACDEPTASLDKKTGAEIIKLIKEVSKDKLVLIVTHNPLECEGIATRRIELKDSTIISDTRLKELDKVEGVTIATPQLNKMRVESKLWLALRGMIRKPKGTLFRLFTMLAVMISILVLSCYGLSLSGGGERNTFYNLQSEDRVVLFEDDHNEVDSSKLDSLRLAEAYSNAFYEDIKNNIYFFTGPEEKDITLVPMGITEHRTSYRLIYGREPVDGEALILLPPNYRDIGGIVIDYKGLVNSDAFISGDYSTNKNPKSKLLVGKISGVAITDEVMNTTLYFNGSLSNEAKNAAYSQLLSLSDKDGSIYSIYEEQEKTILYIPNNYLDYSYEAKIGNYKANVDIEIKKANVNRPKLSIGKDFYNGSLDINMPTYEVSIYGENTTKLTKKIDKLGLESVVPFEIRVDNYNTVLLNGFIGGLIIISALILVLGFILIKLSYKDRIKDFTIIRCNNCRSRDLKEALAIEVLFLSLISIVISLGIVGICYTLNVDMFMTFNLAFGLIFTLIMLVFSVIVAISIKNKVGNKSLISSLRGGELND